MSNLDFSVMTDESHHGMEELCTYNVLAVDLLSLKIRLDSCHEDLINISFSVGSTGHIRAWASKHPVPVCDNKMQRKIPGRSYPTLNMESNEIRICSKLFKWQVGKSWQIYKFHTQIHLPRPLAHQPLQRRCCRCSWNRARGLPGPSQE